jgi:8-oxo-dGTP pyrophosphatase MutT (NUDIX family)
MNQSILQLLKRRLIQEAPINLADSTRIPAAVMVPFFERNGTLHLLFTKRSEHLRHHKNEISFPGGAMESADGGPLATALRELQEEVAASPEEVEILGRLGELRTVSSYFIVVPYVGFIRSEAAFQANESEVAELLEVPLDDLLDPAIFSEEKRLVDQLVVPVYYYRWQSHTIWGLTGRILKTLLDLIRT